MSNIQKVRCPNCGRPAERHIITTHQLLKTQCAACDYLLITALNTGKVLEAYAPGVTIV